MNFWDTSAIIAMLAGESAAPIAERIVEGDAGMVVWWGTIVECTSAVARRERGGSLRSNQVSDVLGRVDQLAALWHEVEPERRIREVARRLLRVHPLRAADAFQLAAAISFADGNPARIGFVSFDERLNDAAAREGFAVLAADAVHASARPDAS